MKNLKLPGRKPKKASGVPEQKVKNRIAFQGGTYSLAITAIVLAILVALNIMVSALPSTYTNLDISSSKLYSITSNTKVVVNALQDDVTIYWIVQSGEEDSVIENLLNKYDSLSDHIEVVKRIRTSIRRLRSSIRMRRLPTTA